jgi:hypothetical protein
MKKETGGAKRSNGRSRRRKLEKRNDATKDEEGNWRSKNEATKEVEEANWRREMTQQKETGGEAAEEVEEEDWRRDMKQQKK